MVKQCCQLQVSRYWYYVLHLLQCWDSPNTCKLLSICKIQWSCTSQLSTRIKLLRVMIFIVFMYGSSMHPKSYCYLMEFWKLLDNCNSFKHQDIGLLINLVLTKCCFWLMAWGFGFWRAHLSSSFCPSMVASFGMINLHIKRSGDPMGQATASGLSFDVYSIMLWGACMCNWTLPYLNNSSPFHRNLAGPQHCSIILRNGSDFAFHFFSFFLNVALSFSSLILTIVCSVALCSFFSWEVVRSSHFTSTFIIHKCIWILL